MGKLKELYATALPVENKAEEQVIRELIVMIRSFVCVASLMMLSAGYQSKVEWTSWRGPQQSGAAREPAVVTSWSTDGENLLWKSAVGGRSTPILLDGRLCAITPVGEGESVGERVVCMDADTGKLLWEHRFNVFHTDIVRARLGWTSVVGDSETGNLYAHGTGGEFFCFDRNGKVLWKRSLGEELGRYSGYGGRLHTPIIDEDRVVISYIYILTNWGTGKKKSGHRYVAFNKHTGEVQWWSQPGVKPLDTTYSTPVVTVIDGKRMLIAGNADGNVYGMLARTGQRVWKFRLAKRGINTSVVVNGKYVYVTHSEENIAGTEMGSVLCIDGSKTGDITDTGVVWRIDGVTAGYSSPSIANGRLYVVTNSATLICYDAGNGRKYWEYSLGRVMKGSPVVTSDGVIYAGTVNGKFHILRDQGDRCVSLDTTDFGMRADAVVEINGSPVVAGGRVYFMTAYDTYCLGVPKHQPARPTPPVMAAEAAPDPTKPDKLAIVPMDVTLAPGEQVTFKTKLFDVNGRLIGSPDVEWVVDGPAGVMSDDGTFTASTRNDFSAGIIRGSVDGRSAEARVRIGPRLPFEESFDQMAVGTQPPGWIGVDLRTAIVEKDGSRVLHKMAKSPSAPYSRMRSFSGPSIPAGYTVEADIMAEPKKGRRPVLSDMGLINARYKLIMLGYEKQLRLVTYSPIPRLRVDVPFAWEANTWYRAKLRVDVEDGKGIVRGKVWLRGQREPDRWMIEMIDSQPNLEGSPGLYAYSKGTRPSKPGSSVFFDRYKVYRNDE